MKAFQLVANGTEMKSCKNRNIMSRKIFTNSSRAEEYKAEFWNICTNPIEGYDIFLDPDKEVEISFLDIEIIGAY